jgi:hypothetical protein
MRILLTIITLCLTACSSTQGVSVYSFTNSEIEAVLNQQLPKLKKEVSLMGLPVDFEVKSLQVNIGPDNRDVVALGFDSSAKISAFVLDYPLRLAIQIEGSPFYDSNKKAVFLRDIKLLNSSVDAGGFKGNLSLLDGEAMSVINNFLAVNPVYRLDTSNTKVALLSKIPLNMKIREGKIELVPNL